MDSITLLTYIGILALIIILMMIYGKAKKMKHTKKLSYWIEQADNGYIITTYEDKKQLTMKMYATTDALLIELRNIFYDEKTMLQRLGQALKKSPPENNHGQPQFRY